MSVSVCWLLRPRDIWLIQLSSGPWSSLLLYCHSDCLSHSLLLSMSLPESPRDVIQPASVCVCANTAAVQAMNHSPCKLIWSLMKLGGLPSSVLVNPVTQRAYCWPWPWQHWSLTELSQSEPNWAWPIKRLCTKAAFDHFLFPCVPCTKGIDFKLNSHCKVPETVNKFLTLKHCSVFNYFLNPRILSPILIKGVAMCTELFMYGGGSIAVLISSVCPLQLSI